MGGEKVSAALRRGASAEARAGRLLSLPYRNRRIRRFGWLMVLAASGANAVLFLSLGWVNRAAGRPSAIEDWTTVEVFRAEPPLESKLQMEEEVREAVAAPAASAEPEPMRSVPMKREVLLPRLVERWPEVRLELPAIAIDAPSVRQEPDQVVVERAVAERAGERGAPMDLARVDEGPQKLRCPAPDYPLWAKAEGAEAVVTLRFVIEASGEVRDIEVQRVEGDERFAEAARGAVARWEFRPATHRGSPVAVWCVQRVRFRLDD